MVSVIIYLIILPYNYSAKIMIQDADVIVQIECNLHII